MVGLPLVSHLSKSSTTIHDLRAETSLSSNCPEELPLSEKSGNASTHLASENNFTNVRKRSLAPLPRFRGERPSNWSFCFPTSNSRSNAFGRNLGGSISRQYPNCFSRLLGHQSCHPDPYRPLSGKFWRLPPGIFAHSYPSPSRKDSNSTQYFPRDGRRVSQRRKLYSWVSFLRDTPFHFSLSVRLHSLGFNAKDSS